MERTPIKIYEYFQVKKFETEIDDIKSDDAPEFEKLLRKMRYFLHENHYWILDVKRKLIDIYGNKPGYELYKIDKVKLMKSESLVSANVTFRHPFYSGGCIFFGSACILIESERLTEIESIATDFDG